MSGVIDIHPVRADADTYREVTLSLYNASALAAGRFDQGRGDWAISARRGNLDRVLEWSGMKLGEPMYSDIYGHVAHSIGDSMSLAANILRFDDDIKLADSDAEEQARARYRDRYLWVRLDAHPQAALTGSTLLARSDLESVRRGTAEQPGISRGTLDDRREFTVHSFQTDWSLRASDAVTVEFGTEWRHNEGHYHYRDAAEFDLLFDVRGQVTDVTRAFDIDYRPRGDQYGAYAAIQAEVAPPLTVETGLRWDRSTLVDSDEHWSPRASALLRLNDSTRLRASWGRFIQTQGIDELPASDGIVAFAPAQRADHWVVGLEKQAGEIDVRLDAYTKRYFDLHPRSENILNDVVILPELKPDRMRLVPSQARAHGIELSLRSVRSRPLFWWASYTWSRAEDIYDQQAVPRGWDQRHAVHAGIGWESEHWEMSLVAAWRSGWPQPALVLDTEGETPIVRTNLAGDHRLGTYIDVDARIARNFRFGDDSSLTAFFEISNAFNRRNECCTEFELDDESEEPVLVLESIRSLPLLPSLGVIWRF
jgi:outer membrane receptor protein involved in Fe transport